MPEFGHPFSVLKQDRLLTHKELVRAIRFMVAAEYEAIQLYQQLAESTDNVLAQNVLQDIADEERVNRTRSGFISRAPRRLRRNSSARETLLRRRAKRSPKARGRGPAAREKNSSNRSCEERSQPLDQNRAAAVMTR